MKNDNINTFIKNNIMLRKHISKRPSDRHVINFLILNTQTKEQKMNKEKKLLDDLKWTAKLIINEIERLEEKKEISDYENGYKEAMYCILEKIERYEKETNNNK